MEIDSQRQQQEAQVRFGALIGANDTSLQSLLFALVGRGREMTGLPEKQVREAVRNASVISLLRHMIESGEIEGRPTPQKLMIALRPVVVSALSVLAEEKGSDQANG